MPLLISTLFFILMMPLTYAWSGLVLSIMWGWYIVPVFGLPQLSIYSAVGVAIVASYFIFPLARHTFDGNSPTEKAWTKWFSLNIGLGFLLGIGWVWHALGLFK